MKSAIKMTSCFFLVVYVNVNDTLQMKGLIGGNSMYTISDLTNEFNMTTRTIRYYEELGMLHPKRTNSGQRIFSKMDRSKMKLIIRGKRLDFSLKDIKEMIIMFDIDSTGQRQLETSLIYGMKKMTEIDEKILRLELMKLELEELQTEFTKLLNNGR